MISEEWSEIKDLFVQGIGGKHGPLSTLPGSTTELTMLGVAHKVHPPPFYGDFAQEFVHP